MHGKLQKSVSVNEKVGESAEVDVVGQEGSNRGESRVTTIKSVPIRIQTQCPP